MSDVTRDSSPDIPSVRSSEGNGFSRYWTSALPTCSFAEQPDAFPRLPEIAERLGVKPLDPGECSGISLTMKDGRQYDFVALIGAFLDHLDKASAS